jgi:hypothetical protein
MDEQAQEKTAPEVQAQKRWTAEDLGRILLGQVAILSDWNTANAARAQAIVGVIEQIRLNTETIKDCLLCVEV